MEDEQSTRNNRQGERSRQGAGEGNPSRGKMTSSEMSGTDDIQIVDVSTLARPQKRNYYWCPVMECSSGPVQKMAQHLQKVHKMTPTTAAQVSRRKRRAPVEAVRLRTPNPHTRSSHLQDLPLFVKKQTSQQSSTSRCAPSPSGYGASPDATLSSTAAAASDDCTSFTSITLSIDGRFHQGGGLSWMAFMYI